MLVESITEVVEKDLDELAIFNGVAEFTELIGDSLEALTVGANAGVTLNDAAKLRVEGADASIDVVLKKPAKGGPKGGGVGGVAEDQVEDLGAHPLVDPLYNSKIVFKPARIRGARDGVDVDVLKKIAPAEMNLEEMTPVIILVFW